MRTLTLLIFTLFASYSAVACDCVPEVEMSLEYHRTRAVFIGKVTKVVKAENGRENIVYIEVSENFKGVKTGQLVKVRTNASGAACGFGFKMGYSYLIYANKHPRSNDWSTSICSRTKGMREAKNDLIYIVRETGTEMKPEWEKQFRETKHSDLNRDKRLD